MDYREMFDDLDLNLGVGDLTGSRFLTNTSVKNKSAIIRVAKETGFDVYTEDVAFYGDGLRVLKGSIGVYTRQPSIDHSPFWKRFDEIRGKSTL